MDLDEFAEQVRSTLLRKAPDVSDALVDAGPIFDDSQVIINIDTFEGERFTLTVEQV